MPIRTALIALVIAGAPTFSLANCGATHTEATMASCAQGMVWDAAKQACVDKSTS